MREYDVIAELKRENMMLRNKIEELESNIEERDNISMEQGEYE